MSSRPFYLLAVYLVISAASALAQDDMVVYDDARINGWVDWGWAMIDCANGSPVHGGSGCSISVSADAWQALSIHHAALGSGNFTALTFWINGGSSGGQSLAI